MKIIPATKWLSALSVLLLASVAHGAPAAKAAKPDTVALSFAWKPGMRASVTTKMHRTRVVGEKTERAVTWRYEMQVDPDTAGLRIRFANPVFDSADTKVVPASPVATRIAEQMGGLMPDFVVTSGGDFKRVHDPAGYQNRFVALMKSLMPDSSSSSMQELQTLMTSENFLNSKSAEQWNALVATWIGGAVPLGQSYGFSNKEPIALLPGEVVQMNYTLSAKRRLACSDRGAGPGCVELELSSVADHDDLKRVLLHFLDKFSVEAASVVYKELELENVILLVTEPKGLIPHRMTVTRSMKGVVASEGKDVPIEQVDVTRTEYAYP